MNYSFRMHDTRLGRFLSTDPLEASYAHNSPFAFSENRVIDGVELEGLEYIHYLVYLDCKGGFQTKVIHEDFRDMSKEQIEKIHGVNSVVFYQTYSQSFGKEGRGVKYTYFIQKDDGSYEKDGESVWEVQQDNWTVSRHGLYYGSGSITKGGPKLGAGPGKYDFNQKPIDITDAIAKEHDVEEDEPDFTSWTDPKYIHADIRFVKKLELFISMVNDGTLVNDPFTNRELSNEAYKDAQNAINLFTIEINRKKAYINMKFSNGHISADSYKKWLNQVASTENESVSLPNNNK